MAANRIPLRPLAVAAAWLVGWAIAINLALLALTQVGATAWLADRQTGTGFVDDNRDRVAGAVADYRAGRIARGDRLVAVTGISNVREGVDLDVLRAGLGPDVRVLGVAGAGAGAPSVVDNAATLLDSPLRPDMVVLGIAPLQLLDTLVRPGARPAGLPPPTTRERLRAAARRYAWVFARRNDISIAVERALLGLRGALFRALDVRLPAPEVASPWRPMMRLMGSEHYPEAVLRAGLAFAGALGAYDRRNYERASAAPALIADLVRRFRARGAEVVVVATPEHSRLRGREPRGVVTLIAARLRRDAGAPRLRVLDLRGAVADDGFVDLSHLNAAGSRTFSATLAAAIGRPDRTRPPLMAGAAARP